MLDQDNYCYCPEFNECAVPMDDEDEWDFSGCDEVCKDGMIRLVISQTKNIKRNASLV